MQDLIRYYQIQKNASIQQITALGLAIRQTTQHLSANSGFLRNEQYLRLKTTLAKDQACLKAAFRELEKTNKKLTTELKKNQQNLFT